MAFVFLAGPESFLTLSHAQIQYSNLSAAAWGNADDTITYEYDDNGSLTSKVTDNGANDTEHVDYEYNLQGRLDKATTTTYTAGSPDSPVSVVEYTYNTAGIRTQKYTYQTPCGESTKSNEVTTDYLIDPYNHTGYAQVLEETTGSATITYTIGDDVIAQHNSTDGTEYLLYDGHGSTRQLADDAGAIVTDQNYSYDAYGVMLGSAANPESGAGTKMLYAGEQYDPDFSGYYNRARYYNQSNGTFNRVDPYAGNLRDPQSLHKYAYCHANPVNAIDPSGKFTIVQMAISLSILALVFTVTPFIISRARNWGIKSGTTPKKVGIINGLGGFTEFMYRWDGISIKRFANKASAAGHTVTFAESPDEEQVVSILNSNDIVFVLAHGSPDHDDENGNPFAGMSLGGTTVHNDEDYVTPSPAGIEVPLSARWVTANELKGRVNNPNLEFVAAVCRLGRTNKMYRAIGAKSFVGLSGNGNSASTNRCMKYVVERLNGVGFQAASTEFSSGGSMYVVNPTRTDF